MIFRISRLRLHTVRSSCIEWVPDLLCFEIWIITQNLNFLTASILDLCSNGMDRQTDGQIAPFNNASTYREGCIVMWLMARDECCKTQPLMALVMRQQRRTHWLLSIERWFNGIYWHSEHGVIITGPLRTNRARDVWDWVAYNSFLSVHYMESRRSAATTEVTKVRAIRLPFGCNSNALRPFDDLRYDRAAARRPK